MGNCAPAPLSFPREILDKELKLFVQFYGTESKEVYCLYYEFGLLFSLFLQRQSQQFLLLSGYLGKLRGRSVPTTDDWDTLTLQYLHYLCQQKRYIRYGGRDHYTLLLGVTIHRLPQVGMMIQL